MLGESGPNTSVINNNSLCRYSKLSENTEIFRLNIKKVHTELNHFAVCLKLTQHSKSTMLQ